MQTKFSGLFRTALLLAIVTLTSGVLVSTAVSAAAPQPLFAPTLSLA